MYDHLKVLSATPSVSRLYTGVYEVARNVALELNKSGIPIEIHGLLDRFTDQDLPNWHPLIPSVHKVQWPAFLGYSKGYLKSLLNSTANVGHAHALWSYSSFALSRWSKIKNLPYMLSANGYLDDWALNNSKFKKLVAFKAGFRQVLERASCIQVNSFHEFESVRKLGLSNPVCCIPNGVLLPDLSHNISSPWQGYHHLHGKRVLLYLSRIHPKKGVHLLLEAWNQVVKNHFFSDWNLVLVGFNEVPSSYEKQIRDYVSSNYLQDSVLMLHGLYGTDMMACYFNCDAFVLPSFSEGAAIAALNAWAFAKPSILTPHCNLLDPVKCQAGFRIETSVDSIISAITQLISADYSDLKAMGQRGRRLAEEYYSWNAVSRQLLEVYNWLHSKEFPAPSTLYQD